MFLLQLHQLCSLFRRYLTPERNNLENRADGFAIQRESDDDYSVDVRKRVAEMEEGCKLVEITAAELLSTTVLFQSG